MSGSVMPPRRAAARPANRRESEPRLQKSRRRVRQVMNAIPDDLLINAPDEVRIRQDLVLTALGRRPADRSLRVGRLLDVHSRTWSEDPEIVFKGRRIAWIGPAGSYPGEVHKHIESSHLTPEWEAALVLPHGNTWTCEASHEFSNVNGARNLEFWFEAR